MPKAPLATNTPPQMAIDTSQIQSSSNADHRRRRRRRGGRGPPNHEQEAGGNTHIQSPIDQPSRRGPTSVRLNGEAPEFIPASVLPVARHGPSGRSQRSKQPPGQQTTQQSAPAPALPTQPSSRPTRRRTSLLRSTASDVAGRIHEDISNNIYECAICTNPISRHGKVWSCHSCWTVFHNGCVKKWSKNEGSAAAQVQTEDGQLQPRKQWRCPGCNLPQDALPSTYYCWCEKEEDPKNIPGLPPHSCGQTCGRQRKSPKLCPHPCDMTCHAGPCPPCSSMGPLQSCFCAKETTSRRCLETNYDSGWSCGQTCDDVMPCGDHNCPRPCHQGLCGACQVNVKVRCYCGRVNRTMDCEDLEEDKESDGWIGRFDCHQVCKRPFDCAKHECEKTCHPQEQPPSHCPRSPESVTHCPCGKTALSELTDSPRTSCTDHIPHCEKDCAKRLSCGHKCPQICHAESCPPCLELVSIACRCRRSETQSICHERVEEAPQCQRACRAHLNCGRHECGERCCTGERKAADRLASRRKLKGVPLDVARQIVNEVEPEHICTRMCGRALKCGHHACQDLCHKGPCNSCKEAIFEDLSCNCGRTTLQAPLPCGTRPPACTSPCERRKLCGHAQTAHNCHTDDESCPPCPFLTEKVCVCTKKTLKNQPCWRAEASCGLSCGRRLKCGSHSCRKPCHRASECEDVIAPCQQPCGKAKKVCGHACDKPCHAPSTCKEDKACPFKIITTCPCQSKKEEVRCNARAAIPDQASSQTALKCDDECARLERNRILATALQISDDHTDDHVPYSTATLNMYLEDVKWARTQEEVLRVFAADSNERRLRLAPMRSRQREFIHSTSEDFGLDSESMDPEPHRHVVLFKTPKFVAAPMKTLQQAARIKRAALNVGAPIHSVKMTDVLSANAHTPRWERVERDWNAIILDRPRFGLTVGELQPHLLKASPTTHFDIRFLTSADQVLLIPSNRSSVGNDVGHHTQLLENIEPSITAKVMQHELASESTLGLYELSPRQEPRILHKRYPHESTKTNPTPGGWSQVAAKGSATAKAPRLQAVGQKSVYTVLGSRMADAKKKEKAEAERQARKHVEVVDDWQEAAERDERAAAEAETKAEADEIGGAPEEQGTRSIDQGSAEGS